MKGLLQRDLWERLMVLKLYSIKKIGDVFLSNIYCNFKRMIHEKAWKLIDAYRH
jgi:hypothetical protein